jgi:hypothetical protein
VVCCGGTGGDWVWVRWRRREFEGGGLGFVFEDSFEGGGEEPGGWEDVSSSLAFEEEGEPQGEGRAVRWTESGSCALAVLEWGETVVGLAGQILTPRRFRLSRR